MGTPSWKVLVVFGASGTGKSTLAAALARKHGCTWLQVDDLRLALQYSNAQLPVYNDELYWFLRHPDFPLLPANEVLDAFIGTARALEPAVRIVIESHVATDSPMVIEGDGILPGLSNDESLRSLVDSGAVRFCCLKADSVDELMKNMIDRGRGVGAGTPDRARLHAMANWTFNCWLADECARLDVPVVSSRPFDTLMERVELAIR